MKAIVKEFIARGLDKDHSKEIGEWKKYIREQKFSIKIDKQMKTEIDSFRKEIKGWEIKELEEIVIEGLNCLKETKKLIQLSPCPTGG